jgi:signal transduction histidine kinase
MELRKMRASRIPNQKEICPEHKQHSSQVIDNDDLPEMENKYDSSSFYESAARVIHDINSPIATIEMCLFTLSQEIQNDTLSIIKSALQNVRNITQSFHAEHYAKHLKITSQNASYRTTKAKESINFKSLIDTVIEEKRFEWHKKQYEFHFNFAPATNHLKIKVYASDIKRMLSNLLNNAIEACLHTAKINLVLIIDNDYLCLSISDNGIGMDKDKIESYLSGVSTKHEEKGLGLSGAKIVMDSLNGRILVSSQKGLGANIKLYFPISEV